MQKGIPTRQFEPIPGYPDYLAGRDGRIFSLLTGTFLVPNKNPSGHLYVKIRNEHGVVTGVQVYRLVLFAFVGPAPAGTEGCHRDGNHDNNRLSNLRWDIRAENIQDYRRQFGRHWLAHLPIETALKIRSELTGKRGEVNLIAEKYGVTRHVIRDIVRGRTYKEIK